MEKAAADQEPNASLELVFGGRHLSRRRHGDHGGQLGARCGGLPRGERFLEAFFPPNFADNRGVVWDGIQESIWMAVIATVAGIALSVPIGLGAARNLAPKWVYGQPRHHRGIAHVP